MQVPTVASRWVRPQRGGQQPETIDGQPMFVAQIDESTAVDSGRHRVRLLLQPIDKQRDRHAPLMGLDRGGGGGRT